MDSFWDFFWLILTSFLFVAYLIVLFQIIGDLFADRSLGGWGKAAWILLLLLFPLLGSLVYLIANGQAMARRRTEAAVSAKEEADEYIRRVAGGASPTEEISRAQELLQAGAIDEMEFARLKAAALARAEGAG
jgi:hypothetical protein